MNAATEAGVAGGANNANDGEEARGIVERIQQFIRIRANPNEQHPQEGDQEPPLPERRNEAEE